MAQTTYEEYLANLMGNVNPQGGMVTGQMPQATLTAPPAQMAMPDISAIQQAVQGVQNVNQGYAAPQMTDLAKFRTDFEEGRRATAEEMLAQSLGITPTGMMTGDSGTPVELTDAQKAYFDIETPAERDFRMQQVQQLATPAWMRAVLGMGAPVLSGQTNYNIRSEELKREIAKQVAAQQAAIPDVVTPSSGSFSGGWNDGGTGVGVGGGPVGAGGGNAAGGYVSGGW